MSTLIFHLATLMFIGLKLTDNIDWSWWWVLAPSWGIGIFQIVLGFVILIWIAFNRRYFRRH